MDDEPEENTSPLRLLIKSYDSGLLTREQYLQIRSEILKKLARKGQVTHEDLSNFMKIHQDSGEVTASKSYSSSDWIIIILGLLAAIALAFILYG